MNKVTGYNTFQNNYYNNNVQSKKGTGKTGTSQKTSDTSKTDKNTPYQRQGQSTLAGFEKAV